MSQRGLAAILLLTLLATTGCYTQLRQIPAASTPDEESADWESWYAPPGFSFYDTWTLPYYTFYGPARWAWVPYYYYPWWWGPWGPPYGPPAPPAGVETGGRHGWDRGPGSPYIPGIGGTKQPVPSGGGSPTTKPPETKPSTEPSPPQPEDTKPERPKPEEPRRHGWGR